MRLFEQQKRSAFTVPYRLVANGVGVERAANYSPSMQLSRPKQPGLSNTARHAFGRQEIVHMPHSTVVARCPHCHSELPLGLEQSAWLRGDGHLWLFCPLCVRIVAGQRSVITASINVRASGPRGHRGERDPTNPPPGGLRLLPD